MVNRSQHLKTREMAWLRSLPVSSEAMSLGAYILGAGFAAIPPGSPYPPCQYLTNHAHMAKGQMLPAYRFVYITRGAGVFMSKFQENESVQAGDMIILFPKVWHRYHPLPDTGWNEYWIDFDGDYLRRLMARPEFSQKQPIRAIGIQESVLDLFLRAVELLEDEPVEDELLLGILAAQTIVQVLSALKKDCHENRSDAAIIREAKRWLVHDPMPSENLNHLTSRLNISYSLLRRLFKADTGVSPYQFAIEAKLKKASSLLVQTEAATHQIAAQCGMEPSYFSRLFKKKTGMSPQLFANCIRCPAIAEYKILKEIRKSRLIILVAGDFLHIHVHVEEEEITDMTVNGHLGNTILFSAK